MDGGDLPLWGAWHGLANGDPRKQFAPALRAYIDSGRPKKKPKKPKKPKTYFQPPLMTPERAVPAPIQEEFPEDTSTQPPFVPGVFHYLKPAC